MATIEINENTVVRSLVRKGTNAERKKITLAQGELGFVTDLGPSTILDSGDEQTNPGRLFIGNSNQGGVVTGNKYLGNTSSDVVSNFNAQPGDLIFNTENNTLYARKLEDNNGANLSIDFDSLSSGIILGKGLTTDGSETIVDLDGDPTLATNPLVWGPDGNSITIGKVATSSIADIDAFTVLANATITAGPPTATIVGENSVLGRTGLEALKGVTYDQILLNADGTGTATSKPTVSGLTVTELADGASTRYVQADAAGILSASSQSAVFAFIKAVDIYNPSSNNQRTGSGVDDWQSWGGDGSIPAGAKNLIVQCFINLGKTYPTTVNVKGRLSTSLENLGYEIASIQITHPADRQLLSVQAIVPCSGGGAFEFVVNVSSSWNIDDTQTGWGAPAVGGSDSGIPGMNAGLLLQAVGYTL